MIKIIEESKNKIVFNLKDKTHSFCNILRNELLKDKHVRIAAYKVEHPLVNVAEVMVETDGKKAPRVAIVDAVKRLKKVADDLKKEFAKSAKQL